MRFMMAWKAFWKAWKQPDVAKKWIDGSDVKKEKALDLSHLRLLYLFQKSARLIDFLKEDIAPFSDAQVGAAVRKIHGECARSLEEFVTIRPLFEEKEGSSVVVPSGYNPNELKVVGKVKGEPPYQGILRHKGWKAHKLTLPKTIGEDMEKVICPAEIEVKG